MMPTRKQRTDPTPDTMTQLELFIRSAAVKPAHLARESGYSRQHLLRLRKGRMQPTLPCIVAIVAALRRLTGRKVGAGEVFDLTGNQDAKR